MKATKWLLHSSIRPVNARVINKHIQPVLMLKYSCTMYYHIGSLPELDGVMWPKRDTGSAEALRCKNKSVFGMRDNEAELE